MKRLLELRKKLNAKRPLFLHPDHQKRVEVGTRWRRPRGLHNKVRKEVWGKPARVKVGYRGPAEVRGLDKSGLVPRLVYTVAQVGRLDVKTQGAIVGQMGARNRALVLAECQKRSVNVLNVKKVDEKLQSMKESFEQRKKDKKARIERRAQKEKQQAPKKEAQKPKAQEEKAPEQAKQEEKKEMDKVLTQRG